MASVIYITFKTEFKYFLEPFGQLGTVMGLIYLYLTCIKVNFYKV